MSKKDIQLFYEELCSSIVELYNVDASTANDAIRLSDMDDVIKKIGAFVFHDSIETWAESVWACYIRKMQLA